METTEYPARLQIDYPDRKLDRVSTLLRIFYAVPILILIGVVEHGSIETFNQSNQAATVAATGTGILVGPVVLMLLCRRKYPYWWFDWNLELTRFSTRVAAYLALLDDTYPSTDDQQSVHLELDRPVDAEMSRGLPLIKWLLAVPHYIILLVLGIATFFTLIFVWFAILFTGRYPVGAFNFVVGVMRWGLRVQAYAWLLTTDRYPPFSFEP
jgi:Domain of unknown function (DUF4389)